MYIDFWTKLYQNYSKLVNRNMWIAVHKQTIDIYRENSWLLSEFEASRRFQAWTRWKAHRDIFEAKTQHTNKQNIHW